MNPFEPRGPVTEKSETQKKYEEILAKLDTVVDGIGMEMDEDIKRPVAALNLMGFNTTASCGGHFEKQESGLCTPWVDIASPDEPKEKFVGEKEIKLMITQKYGVTMKDINSGIAPEAENEMYQELEKSELTPEFIEWAKKNEEMRMKMQKLLEEFYVSREVLDNIRIKIRDIEYFFRIYSGGEDYDVEIEDLSDEDRIIMKEKVEKYRKEMIDFGEFIRNKVENQRT